MKRSIRRSISHHRDLCWLCWWGRRLAHGGRPHAAAQAFEMAGELAAAALPPRRSAAVQQQAVARLAQKLKVDCAVRFIAAGDRGSAVRFRPGRHLRERGLVMARRAAWSFRLPTSLDGARAQLRHRNPLIGLVLFLGGIALASPSGLSVVRGLTGARTSPSRCRTLGAAMWRTRQGRGPRRGGAACRELHRAAGRIENCWAPPPAARQRVARAANPVVPPAARPRALRAEARPRPKAELARDIAELDHLIDEILLTSRSTQRRRCRSSRSICSASWRKNAPITTNARCTASRCDPRRPALLRRLVRNLLENARHHGARR